MRLNKSQLAAQRLRLLEAAASAFAAGYGHATVEGIAREAHLAKPRIYGYYGSKGGLYLAAVAHQVQLLDGALLAPLGLSEAESLDEFAAAAFDCLLEYATGHPDGFALLFGPLDPVRAARARDHVRSLLRDAMAAHLRTRLGAETEGAGVPGDVDALTTACLSAVDLARAGRLPRRLAREFAVRSAAGWGSRAS